MLMPIGLVNTLLPLIQDGEQAELQIRLPTSRCCSTSHWAG